MLKRLTFSKSRRLVSNRQFKRVLDERRRASDALLAVWMAGNECGHPRLGVSVGKSCGRAVARNRLKRLLREAFRLSQNEIPQQYDYVVMISPGLARRLKNPGGGARVLASLTSEAVCRSFVALVADLAAGTLSDGRRLGRAGTERLGADREPEDSK